MKPIKYSVPLIKQGVQECVQASATALLNYFGVAKTFDQVKAEVPVYIDSQGKIRGTSIGHMATYLIKQGFSATIHTVDIQIFDRSWNELSNHELVDRLHKRQPYLKHPEYDAEILAAMVDGYIQFLTAGGQLSMSLIDEAYLYQLLAKSPFLAVISFNFLNQTAKYVLGKANDKPIPDSIKGAPGTHMVAVMGYQDHQFQIMDPDYEFGGLRWVDSNLLVGCIYLAETDYDSMVISVQK